MSTHYLVDPFTVAGDVIDVTSSETGQTSSTGALLVRVPNGVAINGKPQNLVDLNNSKAAGLLGFYAGFTEIAFDPCISGGIDPASTGYLSGSGFTNHCLLGNGVLTTSAVVLAFAPTVCVVTWETYTFADDDPSSGRLVRTYTEEPAADLACQVTFGAGPTVVSDGVVANIAPADQGTSMVLQFTNLNPTRIYLGSWAVVY